jgi:hypothetical protein
MAHYAKVNAGIVEKIIVAEQDFIDSYIDNEAGKWIQTSYNTIGNKHRLGGTPFRKNYAQVGGSYDKERNAFIPIKPFNSWILNETTCRWEAPVAYPDDGKVYSWNETDQQWDEIS